MRRRRARESRASGTMFPKDNSEWLNWINQDKALYIDKEKIQTLIDQQRTNLADVEYLDLDSVAKVVKDFVNPKVSAENVADEGMKFRDGDSPVEKHIAEVSKKVGGKVKMVGSVDEIDNARVRADIESGKKVRGMWLMRRRNLDFLHRKKNSSKFIPNFAHAG